MIPGVQVSGGCSSDGVYLVIHGSLAEHQLPVEGPCCHVKSSRRDDHLGAFVHHQPGKLWEAEIVTDAKAHLSKFCIKNRHLVSRCQGIGFFKILAAFYINVKKMHLPVLTDLMTISVKNIGSVINIAGFISLRHTSGYEINSVFCGANAYEKKYYFNEEQFKMIPESIKEELHIICVLFTEEVGGVFTIAFEEDGNVVMETNADDDDIYYDEVSSGLLIAEIRRSRQELFESLSLYYRVFIKKEDVSELLDEEDGE